MVSERDNSRSLKIGTRVADYQIDGVLGQGAFGITYLATDVNLQIRVAIKEYFPREFSARSSRNTVRPSGSKEENDFFEWGRERFLSEARILARLDHPNIVAVRRLLEANQTAYLVMDYCDGRPLDEIIESDGPLGSSSFDKLLWPILDALEHVHKAGLIHRDVKPANIFVRSDGSPVLLDFGAARNDISQHSKSVTSLATAGYAPLEQYDTRGNQGPWSDIYGFSATLYRTLTGERPPDAAGRVLKDSLEPLSKRLNGKHEGRILQAIDKGLAILPEARPQSVAAWRSLFGGKSPLSDRGQEAAQRQLRSGSEEGVVNSSSPKTQQKVQEVKQESGSHSLLIWGFSLSCVVGILFWISNLPESSSPQTQSQPTAISITSPPESLPPKNEGNRTQEGKGGEKGVLPPAQRDTDDVKTSTVAACPSDKPSSQWTDCKGSETSGTGAKYTGTYKQGVFHGYGELSPGGKFEGDLYLGEFRNGTYHGKGTYTFANGNRYVGEWRDGKNNGQGTFFHASGDKYQGGFKDNNFEGKGTYTYKSGDVFTGLFRAGVRQGKGSYRFSSGEVHESNYVDGKETNPVTVRFTTGAVYVGDVNFETQRWEGRGTYSFKDGSRYVGEYKDGKRHGSGTLYLPSGQVYQSGVWRAGEYISTSSQGDNQQRPETNNAPPAYARATRAIPLRAQDKALMEACNVSAKEGKKDFPKVLDLLTTAVDISCVQSERGVLLIYKYNYDAVIKWDSSGEEHHRSLRRDTVRNFCGDVTLKSILSKIDAEHHYYDKDKKLGMVVRVTREDCS